MICRLQLRFSCVRRRTETLLLPIRGLTLCQDFDFCAETPRGGDSLYLFGRLLRKRPDMNFPSYSKLAIVAALAALLSACGAPQQVSQMPKPADPRYAEVVDEGNVIAAVDPGYLTERTTRTEVAYPAADAPGTIVVDPFARFLYLVQPGNRAIRYGIAVGREGYGFSGDAAIHRKEAWPRWTPTANMVRKDPEIYGPYAGGMAGGIVSFAICNGLLIGLLGMGRPGEESAGDKQGGKQAGRSHEAGNGLHERFWQDVRDLIRGTGRRHATIAARRLDRAATIGFVRC